MKISYQEPKDKRINAKRPVWREFLVTFIVQSICVFAGVALYRNRELSLLGDWGAYGAIVLNTVFLAIVANVLTHINSHMTFSRPIMELRNAARKVAGGDFTVRVLPQRQDGKYDEMEVLIQDFNTMVSELSANETLKSDFIANVSHEIKTPLAVIKSYSDALKDPALSEEKRQEYAAVISESAERLSTLVANILRLNKMESQAIVETERFCLDEQLAECIIALDEVFDEKNLDVQITMDEGVFIESDKSLLEIVWNNLLNNAIKYTDEGGTIRIGLTQATEGGARVVISDNGCGMSKETMHHIFDKFYQGDTSHASQGNGLGLAMVHRVVELLDATVTVESKEGEGSTFTISL